MVFIPKCHSRDPATRPCRRSSVGGTHRRASERIACGRGDRGRCAAACVDEPFEDGTPVRQELLGQRGRHIAALIDVNEPKGARPREPAPEGLAHRHLVAPCACLRRRSVGYRSR